MIWLCVLVLCLSIYVHAFDGKNPVIQVTNAYRCPDSDNKVKFHDTVIQNVDDNGFKSFSGTIELPFNFTDQWEYQLRVDRLNNGDWQKDIYSREGNVCEDVKVYIPDAWKKVINLIKPPFEAECFAPLGTYRLDNLEIFRNELKLPGVLYGNMRATCKVYDLSGEEIFCGIVELKLTF